jgi:cell division protease FtsH
VHKVSVVSRGQALGVTIQLPLKDRYLTSKSELIARMAAAMGGRAAEEIIFGDVTTGAKQDIEYATNVARQMVCEFGMSERLGLVTLHRKGDGDSLFFSELTAADVDAEVKALTDAAYRQAYEICESRRATLIRIADHLQLVETMDGEEIDRLLLEEAAAPPVSAGLPEIAESAAAPRIAAAEAHNWDDGSSDSVHESEPGPPIAAS